MQISHIIASPDELAAIFVERVVSSAARASADGRRCSIVLPGGSVAEAFFPALAKASLDWSAIDLFWGDERAVPPGDPESNYRIADDLLLRHVSIPATQVHRMPADDADLDAAARAYDAEIARGAFVPFDLVLLGVGPDGHVCSLFPEHPALRETERRVLPIADSPKPPSARLTLTLPALRDADIYVAAFGASKAEAVRDAYRSSTSLLPVALAARGGRSATLMLDAAAGALI